MNAFLSTLAASFPPASWQDVTVLVAVSGGADSVALLRGQVELKEKSGEGRLVAAHFNHRLRGAESDADEEFVRSLCNELQIGLETGSGAVAEAAMGDGLEAAARAARYAFLTETAQRVGARHVVTAHTADDQVETILHRILRGTGISGLAGIPRARELSPGISLFRPLLAVTRAEVLAYLAERDQTYREDSSNALLQFTRNRLRHELLPLLEREYAPTIRASLLRMSKLAAENQECLSQQLQPLLAQHVRVRERAVVINCPPLASAHRHMLRELLIRVWRDRNWPLQQMSSEKWDQLSDLVQLPVTAGSEQFFPGNIRATRRGDELWALCLDEP